MKKLLFLFSIGFIVFLDSCMGGSTTANEWINGLKAGLTKEEIEKSKPKNVIIYWDKPIKIDSITTEYDVRYEDRTDFYLTPFFIVFENGKYKSYGGRN